MITTVSKKRVIRDFDKLEKNFQKRVIQSFPNGIGPESITFLSISGKNVAVITFETEDTYYLLRLPSLRLGKSSQDDDYSEEYLPMDDYQSDDGAQSFEDDTTMDDYDPDDDY